MTGCFTRYVIAYFKRDLVDLASELGVRPDANSFGNRCLIVDADVGSLIRREDIGLRLLDTALGDRFSFT